MPAWRPGSAGQRAGHEPYDHFGGFTACVIAITVVYALILLVVLLVRRG
jgi:hypothetical protein